MFQKDKFWEKQKIYLWETWKKHIMCFSDFSFRNTFCVSVGKTLWKSQNVSLNGFFWGKHHPAPAVEWFHDWGALYVGGNDYCMLMQINEECFARPSPNWLHNVKGVRLRCVRTVPAMIEMPDGWPHIGLSSGLDAVHMYPDCEFLFLSFQFRFLLFLALVYKTHKLKDRDSFGQSDGKWLFICR